MEPRIGAVLEIALYVDDLIRSVEFYQHVLGFRPTSEPAGRMCALAVTPDQVLLLFKKGASVEATVTPGGIIPPTDGDGSLHVAFSIPASAFEAWQSHLVESGVAVESLGSWSKGGGSIYFRDPDSHVIELKTTNWNGDDLAW